jgi:D-alanyl-D-alanine carboxypeptidase
LSVNNYDGGYANIGIDMNSRKSRKKTLFFRLIISIVFIAIIASLTLALIKNFEAEQKAKQQDNARILAAKAQAAIEAKKKQPVYITLPGAKPIRAIVQDYSQPSSIWAIVSKTHPISVDYVPPDLKIPGVPTRTDKSNDERSVRADIEIPVKNLFDAAAAAGHNLMIGSGYRSAAQQKIYFNNLAASVGEAEANQAIAYPGQSEHQTGLAMDISTLSQSCYLDQCFATTADGLWLADNSYRFGFILRFPKGAETITGYQYEPWHFRYVGIDLATALHESGLTLDQAWPYLQTADATLRQNGAI